MERTQNKALLAAVLIGIVVCASVAGSLVVELTFHNEGRLLTKVTAKSGSVVDIQAAVNEAISKGLLEVDIPAGNFTFAANGISENPWSPTGNCLEFVVPSQGLTIRGAGAGQTILDLPDNVTTQRTYMFSIAGGTKSGTSWTPTYGKLRITGITFRGRDPKSITGDSAIYIISCKDFRVDHCTFYDMGASGVNVCDQGAQYGVTQWNTNDPPSTPPAQRNGGDPIRTSQGVIDHCGFYDIYKPASTQANIGWGYGVWVRRAEHYWWIYWDEDIWSLFGKYNNNVFIEDNYFRGCRHVVASIGGGVYVFRHNVMEDLRIYEASTTGHPVRDSIYGMRANEMYDNVFRYTGTYGTKFLGPLWKGGGGLYYNNTIENMIDAIEVGNCEANNVFYPRGNIKDLYVWDNTMISCDRGLYQQNPYSSGGWTAPLAIEGTDFFSDMTGMYTTQQISNMVAANGYTRYPYPHPLTLAT